MALGFGGGLLGKLKSVNPNRLLNLGLSLWGLQIGANFSRDFMYRFFSQNPIGGIKADDMVKLVDVGTDLARAALLIRFVKNLPFGNVLKPIIAISTAAVALPNVLAVMLAMAFPSTTAQQYRPSTGSGVGFGAAAGAPSPFLSRSPEWGP